MHSAGYEKADLLLLLKQLKGKTWDNGMEELLHSKISSRLMRFKPRPVNVQTSKKELNRYFCVFQTKPCFENLPKITADMSHALRFWLAIKTFNRMNEVKSGSAKLFEFSKHFDLESRVIKRGLKSKKPKYYNYLSPGEFNSISLPLILVNYGKKENITDYVKKGLND